jgi:hypothetical protein
MSQNSQNQNSVFQIVSVSDRGFTLNVGRSHRLLPAKDRMYGRRKAGLTMREAPATMGTGLCSAFAGRPSATWPAYTRQTSSETQLRSASSRAVWSYPANIWAALTIAQAVRG